MTRITQPLQASTSYEYSILETDEPDIRKALYEAANLFASQHTGLPEGIITTAFRRMIELPVNEWNILQHGPIPIHLHAPSDQSLHSTFSNVSCSEKTFIAFRKEIP